MMKHLFIYLMPAAISLLTACQADYDESGLHGADSGEALKITVAEIVNTVSGPGATRSYEAGASTMFEKGDRIGLIVLGKEGKILADNVPYIFDGNRWDFDEDNTDGKSRIYYDATMYKYIAYYPYTTQADVEIEGNAEDTNKKVKKLMEASVDSVDTYFEPLPLFKWRPNQSNEEDFRCCDPMVWSETYDNGLPTERNIKVELSHIRNCFVLDTKVRWELNNGETIHYHPRNYEIAATYDTITPQYNIITATKLIDSDTGFDDFFIYLDNYDKPQYLKHYNGAVDSTRVDLTYHAKDGSYRYILGDGDEYTFNWEYTYRDGKTYGGKHTIRPNDTNSRSTRYFHDETIDMGKLIDEKVKVGDFFCKKNDIGYPLPYDAVDLLDPRSCVGIVFYAGHYKSSNGLSDSSDYSSTLGSVQCHGYALALTEARTDTVQWCVGRDGSPLTGNNMVTGNEGYQGYRYMGFIKAALQTYNATLQDFPAFYACEVYGTTGWHSTLAPPKNTSGWYLPTITQLHDIRSNLTYSDKYSFKDKESIMKTFATLRCLLPEDCEFLKYMIPNKHLGWWSCSQENGRTARFIDLSSGTDQSTTGDRPTEYHRVRAALSY